MSEDKLKSDRDFFKEAIEFTNKIINPQTEKMFIDYCTEQKFSNNEMMLFRLMLEEAMTWNILTGSMKYKMLTEKIN